MKRTWNYITQDDFPTDTWGAIVFILIGLLGIILYS